MTIGIILGRSASRSEKTYIFWAHVGRSFYKNVRQCCHCVVFALLYLNQAKLCEYFSNFLARIFPIPAAGRRSGPMGDFLCSTVTQAGATKNFPATLMTDTAAFEQSTKSNNGDIYE